MTPHGWAQTTLEEVRFDESTRATPSAHPNRLYELWSVPSFETDRPELLRGNEIGSDKQTVAPGTVLVCKINPRINRVWVVGPRGDQEQIGSTEWIPFFPVDGIEPMFLVYYLRQHTFRDYLASNVSGVGGSLMRVRAAVVDRFPLLVPPLAEQRRIVAAIEEHLSRLDAAVAGLKRVQAMIPRYRAAVLKAAVEGKLLSGYSPASATWNTETVENLATAVEYGSSAKTAEAGAVPVLRMGNIQGGQLDLTTLKFLPASHDEFPRLLLEPGDVLFNRTNSAELVGKTAVYRGSPSPCSFASYLIRVRLNGRCLPDYLATFLNSSHGRNWIASVVSQQVGQANVSGGKLKALSIPLPSLPEQEAIVAELSRRLSLLDFLEAEVAGGMARADRLRQSVLKRAFEGKLVPQDPNDEPASMLLERVRQARATANSVKEPRARKRSARP